MTPTITDQLLHQLVTGSHAEGTTELAVAAAVEHDDRTLLIATMTDDFDTTWDLPTGQVLPGETLLDALHRIITVTTGLQIIDVTGYVGYHDRYLHHDVLRTFVFSVTAVDPDHLCHTARIGHRWTSDPITEFDDFGNNHQPTATAASYPDPPLTDRLPAALQAHARGLLCTEAAIELLIDHQSWLRRQDFIDTCIEHLTSSERPGSDPDIVFVDWVAALSALNAGHLPSSSGEAQLLRIAASLAGGLPVDLREAVTGLDATNTGYVTEAINHAAGHRP